MNTKIIRVATCCLASSLLISGAVFTFKVHAGEVNTTLPAAGVTLTLSEYYGSESDLTDAATTDTTADTKADTKAGATDATEAATTEVEANKAETVKSEYADIAVAQVDNYVNVRATASEDGEVVGKLYNNSAATVKATEGDWYQITSGNVTGYVKCEYVVVNDEALAKSVGRRVALVNTETLRVRSEASADSEIIGLVPVEEELSVTEENGDWVKVSINEGDGWVSSVYVTCSTDYVTAESKEEEEARLAKEEAERQAAEAAAEEAVASQSSDSSSSESSSSASTSTSTSTGSSSGQAVADYACQFVGNPYVWGGTSLTNGADCSGFVLAVYANFGVGVPHSSSALAGVGYGVSYADAQPGDIVCYSGHVGIYIGGGQIVNASSSDTGIRIQSATYRDIVAVRRIF